MPLEPRRYTAEDIQVLEWFEAVRKRPGMYIGSTGSRGLHQLLLDLISYGIDEALAGYCRSIDIVIDPEGVATVDHDGRGLPVTIDPRRNIPGMELHATALVCGHPWPSEAAYRNGDPLSGVGLAAVNALSQRMMVEVRADGKLYRQEHRRGVPIGTVETIGDTAGSGTRVSFLADTEVMGTSDYSFDLLADRCRELACLHRGLQLGVRDEREGRTQQALFRFEDGLVSLVRYLNRAAWSTIDPIAWFAGEFGDLQVEVALQYARHGDGAGVRSFANMVQMQDGTHLAGFYAALTNGLTRHARAIGLLDADAPGLARADVQAGLTAVLSVKLFRPQLGGNIRARLDNPEVRGHVEQLVMDQLLAYLQSHPTEGRAIAERCLAAARDRAGSTGDLAEQARKA